MNLLAVLRREIRTIAELPHTYAIASAYLLISGVFFASLFLSTRLPDLERYFSNVAATLVVLVPIVAMRSFAEERRTGFLEVVLSWPVSRPALVVGKYIANTLLVSVLVSVMWLYVRLLSAHADIEVGKSLGEYVGLLFLVAAFNALALGVSARSSTPTGSAFVSFGLLLALWILDFVPGWLDSVAGIHPRDLAPTTHLEGFGRGVIDLGDALYFLALTVVGLGVALASVSDRRIRAGWPRATTAAPVVMALSVASALLFLQLSDSVKRQIDLTPTDRFTLSAASREAVDVIPGEVRLTAFVQRSSPEEVQVRSLVDSFEAAGADFDLDLVDPDIEPSVAKRFGIDGYGQLVIEIGDRSELIETFTEVDLTSALVRLAREDDPRACFTVGHGERAVRDEGPAGYHRYRSRIEQLGIEVVELALGATGGAEALGRCDVVVVAGARVSFLPEEERLLAGYLRNEGRAFVLGAESEESRAQLNRVLEPWGVSIGDRPILDDSSLADDRGAVVALDYPTASPATAYVARHRIPVVLSGTVATELPPGAADLGTGTVLVRSSEASEDDTGGRGPFDLAVVSDISEVTADAAGRPDLVRTRIGVVGTADVASNRFLDALGNADFSVRFLQWVAQADEVIGAAHSPGGVRKVVLTDSERDRLVRSAVVFPGLAPLPLLAVALLRLRRG